MHSLSFYSLLSSLQEVDFFTDIIVETGIAPELDHSLIAELESIPDYVIEEQNYEAEYTQDEIDFAIEVKEEYTVIMNDHTDFTAWQFFGTLEECKEYLMEYSKASYGHRFDARFFAPNQDNVFAEVHYYPKGDDEFITLTKVNNTWNLPG